MNRVRVKICGVTTRQQALTAVKAGADALGLVFYDKSPRVLTAQQAQAVSYALPPFVTRVALFLDADAMQVMQVVRQVRPDVLQFHGRETPEFCRQFDLPYIKTVPMGEKNIDLNQWQADYHDAQALLLDANQAGQAGGMGQSFNWDGQAELSGMPIIIAGGLNAENVGQAIRHFSPYAVDVSSGVEHTPGIKDTLKIKQFMSAVLAATQTK